jgi:hypothetical protein
VPVPAHWQDGSFLARPCTHTPGHHLPVAKGSSLASRLDDLAPTALSPAGETHDRIAMGAVGAHIAMEAADVVVMNDDLRRIAETVRLSRRTYNVLWQNISLALGIKAVFFVLAIFGSATMWIAVFAEMGASLLVVGNGLRLLRARATL